MQDEKFGCCHSYRECSNQEQCLYPEKMNRCLYWTLNLSKGCNFYRDKPKDGYIYLIKNNKPYRISKSNDRNYSYKMDSEEIKILYSYLSDVNIKHTQNTKEYDLSTIGSKENPGIFRVNFKIDENMYNINNFDKFGMTELEAIEIRAMLHKHFDSHIIRLTPDGYFNIPSKNKAVEVINKVTEPVKKAHEQIKIQAKDSKLINGYGQLSFL